MSNGIVEDGLKGKESKGMVNDPRINGKGSSQRDRRVWSSVMGIDVKGEMRMELKVLYMNAQSIRSKVDELEAQLEVGRYDIVGITETWLQEDRAWELNIQGYTSYRKDRQVGRGGGVSSAGEGWNSVPCEGRHRD